VRPVLFAHGLEGHPDGTKPTALRRAGLHVTVPDGRGLVLADRIAALESAIVDGCVLVGSSYGGLAAAWLASRSPARFHGLLLLAPALHHAEAPVDDPSALTVPASLPVRLIHAVGDDIVPIEVSRAFVRRNPHAILDEVEDTHPLRGSLDHIVAAALALAS
jgi:hypothetical protein